MKPTYEVGAPIPESVGLTADLYSEVRELRLAMQKVVDAVKERESELRESIIDRLSKSDDTGAAGKKYRAQIVDKITPSLKDFDAFMDFVFNTGRTDLLHKRVSDKAVADLWEEGQEVPGVVKFRSLSVSITKI